MPKLIGRLCGVALLGVWLSGVASAGPLPTDGNALPAWQGTANLSGTNFGGDKTLAATVEYAVYLPGDFGTSAALGTPVDPSGGTEYIYAYEIFHQPSDAEVLNLSVDLIDGGIPNSSTWIGYTADGGIAPLASNLINGGNGYKDNAKWNFILNNIGAGEHSEVLFFASAMPPTWRVASMQGSLTTTAGPTSPGIIDWVPSPTPEPGTYALAMIGAMCLLVIRFLRRQPR